MTEAAGRRPGQPRAGWTGRLWADIEGTYAAILDHPFIRGLTSGDLAPEAFFYYLTTVALVLLIFTRYRMVRRVARPADEQTGFVAMQTTSAIAGALDPRTDPLPEFYYEDVDPGDR